MKSAQRLKEFLCNARSSGPWPQTVRISYRVAIDFIEIKAEGWKALFGCSLDEGKKLERMFAAGEKAVEHPDFINFGVRCKLEKDPSKPDFVIVTSETSTEGETVSSADVIKQ